MRCRLPAGALLGVLVLAPASTLRAQASPLDGRIPPQTATEVERVADSARAAGLPTEPLFDKALEGATKHAPDARILAAVRGLAHRLADARAALGASAPDADLVAAAGALYQGVQPSDLTQLRAARTGSSLALPLVVLADLIVRGVPPSTATSVVLDLERTGAGDEAFAALRREVEHDIANGAPPAIAASTRARGTLYALPPVRAVTPVRTNAAAAPRRP
jgi:hypothetical protein